jgi:hypothetical protein
MIFEMYLDGQLVDKHSVIPALLRKSNKYLKNFINEFEKKHAELLQISTSKPVYYLNNVPSCMNGFVPLCHPIPVKNINETKEQKVVMPV